MACRVFLALSAQSGLLALKVRKVRKVRKVLLA
jgi:hypothetical protein